MAWTYLEYRAAYYGISVAICLVCTVFVFIVFYVTDKGKEFVHDRIVGIPTEKLVKETKSLASNGSGTNGEIRRCSWCPKATREVYFGILLCLIGSAALTVVGVVIFHNCILVNQMVTNYNDQSCPAYVMDCFIINLDIIKRDSMNITVSFRCTPWDPPPFPSNQTNITAHCFRWGPPQSTKDVLDQLGICTGLLGMFSTFLAIILCLGGTIPQLILSILAFVSCTAAIIVIAVLQAAYATLTYALLGFGIAIGFFGISFYFIKRKPQNPPTNAPANDPTNAPANGPTNAPANAPANTQTNASSNSKRIQATQNHEILKIKREDGPIQKTCANI